MSSKTKKKPRNSKSRPPSPSEIQVGAIRQTDHIKFAPAPTRGTIYQPVLDKMARLKEGQSFTVPVPKGVTPRTMHNRLNAAIRRADWLEPPAGCHFTKGTSEQGEIVISCEKDEEGE